MSGGPFPRISTRGHYDLSTGRTLRGGTYRLYPRSFFDAAAGAPEMAVMVHGLRNDCAGALAKFAAARRCLRRVGYPHPVVGYSYDSNTRGAHLGRTALRALRAGQRIAAKNGPHLARFVSDFAARSPGTRIRLMGHSLGSAVILGAVGALARGGGGRGAVESVHLFGASVGAREFCSAGASRALGAVVASRIVNYYSPEDEVLREAHESGAVPDPVGYRGCGPGRPPGCVQRRVRPRNHRFASYAATVRSFP